MMKATEILGIDFGGSGIKGAPVDIDSGKLMEERLRIETPQPATPKAVADTIAQIAKHFKWKGKPIGVGFPAASRQGIILTATNIDKSWIGVDANKLISEATGCPTLVLNDADAAGIAEIKYGAGAENKGLAMMITVGTGIGTALFVKKRLVPNLEWGHILMPNGKTGEQYAADRIRQEENLSWDEWGKRFNEYLMLIEKLCYPSLFIIGGGVSKKMDQFKKQISISTPVVPAQLLNNAGIIGAAAAAKKLLRE